MRICLSLVVLLAVFAVSMSAQSGTATINGSVTDPSGSAVVNAKVTVRSPDTGFTRETATNESGLYQLPGLKPGLYELSAEAQGFRRHAVRPFTIEVDQIARMDLQLQVGDLAQQIEVVAATPLLQSENATLGALIDTKKVVDLPLNGRNFVQLALLVPGVNSGQPGASRGGGISVGGARSEQNAFQLDGVSNSDQWDNNLVFRPNIDAIQEFKIQVNNYSAEFGKGAGGQINVVTKGGANTLHGTVYAFNRNDAVQARNFFQRDPNFRNSRGDFVAPPFNQNQFGFTVGGPAKRDRTFYFVDYEGFRQVRGQTGIRSVPDEALRAGDFSRNLGSSAGADALGRAVLANQLYDSGTSRLVTDPRTNRTLYARDPFPQNRIPASRFDPVARRVLDSGLWPAPNIPGQVDSRTRNVIQNYADGRSRRDRTDQGSVRIDHRLSDKDYLYGRWNIVGSDSANPGSLPGQERSDFGTQQLASLNYTRTLTPTTVNELRFGFQRAKPESTSFAYQEGKNFNQLLGIPGIPTARAGLPEFTVAGMTGITGGGDLVRDNRTYQLIDSLSFSKGRNLFKAGFEMRRISMDVINNITRTRGTYGFDNAEWSGLEGFPTTGNTFANFLLGLPRSKGRSLANRSSEIFATEYAGYFQDDLKLTSRLTLNMGVRYQFYVPPKERNDHVSTVVHRNPPGSYREAGIYICKDPVRCAAISPSVPTTALGLTLNDLLVDRLPQIMVAGKGVPRSLVDTEWFNFGPRMSLAYRLTNTTVVRTGYGIFWDTVPISYFEDSIENIPWTQEDLQNLGPFQFGPRPAEALIGFANSRPTLSEITPGPNSYSAEFRNAYMQQWNFGVQRQFGGNWIAEVSYAGSKGTKLNRREGLLPAEPRSATAVLPSTLHPQMRLLVPFMVYDNQLVTVSDWYSTTSNASLTYHALMARFERRFSSGLSFINSFTYSRTISDAQPFSGGNNDTGNRVQDTFNKRAEKGLAPHHFKFRFVSSFLYDLPFGRGKAFGASVHPVVSHLIGGWQANGIFTLQSGYPITVRRSGDPLGIATDGAVRPDMVCDPNLPAGDQTINRFFRTDCFTAPPDRFGNAGRSTVIGPGMNNWDIAVFKGFNLTERWRLQFRAEFFNAFNHANWGMPGRDVGVAGFGVINSAADPRIIQFGLKLAF